MSSAAAAPPVEDGGVREAAIRAAMRLVARWLAWRASPLPARDNTALPVAANRAASILVVALAEAGDMVLLSVFLRGLRDVAPAARITLVCRPAVRPLFELSSDVDEIIAYDAAMPRLLRPLMLPHRARRFAAHRLRSTFDLAIVPRWDTDHHLATAVALFSRARRRLWHTERSNTRKRTLNAGFDHLYTDVVVSHGVAHEVDRHLAMLRDMGAVELSPELRLALSDEDRHRASEALTGADGARTLVAVGIGAADPKRRWSIASFGELGRQLRRDFGARLVIVGGPTDVEAQEALLAEWHTDAIGLAGRLSLRQSAAMLQRCQLFIGCDSAPMHLAAAAGVPCIEISCHPVGGDPLHNNAPERFAPWGVRHVVLRPPTAVAPCRTSCVARAPHCILTVTSSMVVQAAATLLGDVAPARLGVSTSART